LAITAGDKPAARGWLEKALAAGVQAPFGLLWDCGLFELIAALPDAAAGPSDLALMGDAAWMAGDADLAKRRWARSISLSSRLSWKPYANLALMSEPGGDLELSYWARLKAAFLAGPPSPLRDGALGAYAAHLARTGRDGEALAMLGRVTAAGERVSGALAVLASAVKGRGQSEGRFTSDLERLAAEYPDDQAVMGATLRALALRGMHVELAVLRDGSRRRALPIENGWYFDAVLLAARGDYAGAIAVLESARGAAGASAANASAREFALGSLFAATDETAESAEAFAASAAAARGGRERCAALKAYGRALSASGDSAAAGQAFRSAAAADPSDVEASILARGAQRKKK
jgi:hypothetical protein